MTPPKPDREGTGIVWFRRDLRLCDHPALRAALDRHERVVPVFCFDDRLLQGRHASGPRTQFLLECLADLDGELRDRGSGLVIRHGKPEEELVKLALETGTNVVHFSREISPFGRQRGRRCRERFEAAGLEAVDHPGLFAVDQLREIRTLKGKPYTVFTPFYKNWIGVERRAVRQAPRSVPSLPKDLAKGRLPSLAALGLTQEVSDPPLGGESAAHACLERFLRDPVHAYSDNHDALGTDRTSRLSPYLHFGCVTPRQIEECLPAGPGPDAFRRQLCWRDFYHHVLAFNPQNARSEFQARYRGRIRWSHAEQRFQRWCQGQTGYPLVDGGMRQLQAEGWMHNRARLVVGSFLTKDLGIDWRWGERWFMRLLIDGDEANNNGNWQWIASVGVDPQPAYRRIYNPALHMERYDPNGDYVRKWVPELRPVPGQWLPEPWKMPLDVQEGCGCLIGRDYPPPMVDHKLAREEALGRYRVDGNA